MEYGISPRQLALGVVSRVACPLPAVRLPLSPIRARANQGKAQRARPAKETAVGGEEAELADANEEPLQQVRSEPNFWSSSEWRGPRNKVISELMRQTYATQKPTFWHALNDPAPAYMHHTVNYHYKEPLRQRDNLVTTPPTPLDENTDEPEILWKPDEGPPRSNEAQRQSTAMFNEMMNSMYAAQLKDMKQSMRKRQFSRMFTPAMNAEEERDQIDRMDQMDQMDNMMDHNSAFKQDRFLGAFGAESTGVGIKQMLNMTRRYTLKGSLMPPHPVANTAYGDEIYAVDCVMAERVGRRGQVEYLVNIQAGTPIIRVKEIC
ncbi:hypothetical protein CYMTET_29694 [Cymbomonas tetramitiformis]|uniref:Uncharacterized protein n=1 Tax=Cymbomonas tetramitiformis TaxID=36881 RepID=A0AAE0FK93_9CHLO|nr:hypothetical protein CYMTET_29694 [Cymbomonas tetramitiformis]